ncbi:MAG: tRNA (adenosine(37)-N6)-threonylcarbamoyltransferase complex dimerization subunit type 1 TsaB [bacterium]
MTAPTHILCADTATLTASVAVFAAGELRAERAARSIGGHGPGLLDQIHGALEDAELGLADIDALVCGLGPGTFTGLRIALATLKGIALARDLPLYGARTTLALAAALPGQPVVAVLDARRGEVFAEGAGLEPCCLKPAELAARLPTPCVLLGDGARKYAKVLMKDGVTIPADVALHAPRAALLRGAVDLALPPPALATLEPTYVRRSDAEINYPDGFPDFAGRLPPG